MPEYIKLQIEEPLKTLQILTYALFKKYELMQILKLYMLRQATSANLNLNCLIKVLNTVIYFNYNEKSLTDPKSG